MSAHLFVTTMYLELPVATKAVLAAMADSADDSDRRRLTAPGLAKLRAWSGLSKTRTLGVVAELVSTGWLERVEAGRQGRRAVFRVFPNGVPPIPSPDEVAARFGMGPASPEISTPVDNGEVIHNGGSHQQDPDGAPRVLGAANRVLPAGPLPSSTTDTSTPRRLPTAPTVEKPLRRKHRKPFPGSSRPPALIRRDDPHLEDPERIDAAIANVRASIVIPTVKGTP